MLKGKDKKEADAETKKKAPAKKASPKKSSGLTQIEQKNALRSKLASENAK